jgi:DNA-binding CsgD family transcriptional regulator
LTLHVVKNRVLRNIPETVTEDSKILKTLLSEMEESLIIEGSIDSNLGKPSYYFISENNVPFDLDTEQELWTKSRKVISRKIRLRHKLRRIRIEFEFVKKNLKKYETLTPREREVIHLIGLGNSNPEIAEKLFISRYTVEQHRKHINGKLKIKSIPHLMRYCYAFDFL